MKINVVKYDDQKTDTYWNGLASGERSYDNEIIWTEKRYQKFPKISSKEMFKKVFGKQQICVVYNNNIQY